MHRLYRSLRFLGLCAVVVQCPSHLPAQDMVPPPATDSLRPLVRGELTGLWRSEAVRLVRGNIDETYTFEVLLHPATHAAPRGVMLIDYGQTASAPNSTRRIRQDLAVRFDEPSMMWVLSGSDARQVAGPALVGVYEADELHCDATGRLGRNRLECRWGSSAHGSAPVVVLMRTIPSTHTG